MVRMKINPQHMCQVVGRDGYGYTIRCPIKNSLTPNISANASFFGGDTVPNNMIFQDIYVQEFEIELAKENN